MLDLGILSHHKEIFKINFNINLRAIAMKKNTGLNSDISVTECKIHLTKNTKVNLLMAAMMFIC